MIAGDLGTVSELNARARADRVAEGAVADVGVEVAGGGTAGVGDLVVTRQNDRRLCTGQVGYATETAGLSQPPIKMEP
jgi:hypothetical protein